MYSAELLAHFEDPRNVGTLEIPAQHVRVENPVCGDSLDLYVLWDGQQSVGQVRYQVRGCTASIACGSALTVWMEGKSREELRGASAEEIASLVGGLPNESRHAATLCVDAVRSLLR